MAQSQFQFNRLRSHFAMEKILFLLKQTLKSWYKLVSAFLLLKMCSCYNNYEVSIQVAYLTKIIILQLIQRFREIHKNARVHVEFNNRSVEISNSPGFLWSISVQNSIPKSVTFLTPVEFLFNTYFPSKFQIFQVSCGLFESKILFKTVAFRSRLHFQSALHFSQLRLYPTRFEFPFFSFEFHNFRERRSVIPFLETPPWESTSKREKFPSEDPSKPGNTTGM